MLWWYCMGRFFKIGSVGGGGWNRNTWTKRIWEWLKHVRNCWRYYPYRHSLNDFKWFMFAMASFHVQNYASCLLLPQWVIKTFWFCSIKLQNTCMARLCPFWNTHFAVFLFCSWFLAPVCQVIMAVEFWKRLGAITRNKSGFPVRWNFCRLKPHTNDILVLMDRCSNNLNLHNTMSSVHNVIITSQNNRGHIFTRCEVRI